MRLWCLCLVGALSRVLMGDEVELHSGDRLLGTVVEQTADSVVLDHPALGRLVIDADLVRAARLDSDPAPPPPPPPADLPVAAPGPAAVGPPAPKPRWDSRLEVGFGANEGTTEESNLRFAFTTTLEEKTQRYKFSSVYSLQTSRGDRSKNRFNATMVAQWPHSESRWGYFGQGTYDFDEFQSWEHRITAGGGLGYHLIDLDRPDDTGQPADYLDLRLKMGGGGRREFGSLNDGLKPEGILGGEIAWQVSPRQRLAVSSTIYPDLGETGEFRLVTYAEWVLQIDKVDGVNFKLGLAHEYQSLTDPGVDHNDLSIYGALVIDF